MFGAFDQCAVDAGGRKVLGRPGSVVLFNMWVNMYVFNKQCPADLNAEPVQNAIAVVASKAWVLF